MTLRILLKITLLMNLFFIVACGPAGPKGVVYKFYGHLAADRTEQALSLMASDIVASLGRDKLLAGLQEGADRIDAQGGLKSLEITDEVIEGDKIKLSVKITFGNGKIDHDTVHLIREGSAWKLTVSK